MPRTVIIDDTPVEARLDAADRTAQQQATQVQALSGRCGALETSLRATQENAAKMLAARDQAHDEAVAALRTEFERQLAGVRLRSCEANLLDYGCKPNDGTFDSGPPINALLRKLGGTPHDGNWVTTSLYMPAGAWYFKTPIETPAKTGLRLRGNGLAHVLNENSYWAPNTRAMGGPASRLVYVGDGKAAAVRQQGLGEIWDGIVLQNGPQPVSRKEPVRDGSIGFELAGNVQPPNGKIEYRSIAVHGFDTAIHTTGGAGGHADESEIGYGWIQDCRTVFRSDCPQSTGWHFRKLMVAGQCETVFDWQAGGGMSCAHLNLMARALLFRLREPKEHVASFKVDYLKIDAGPSRGWRLLDVEQTAWLLHLSVWGEIGKGAIPAADAVKVGGPAGRQFLDIQMVDGNTATLWDWRKFSRLEEAN